MRYLRSAVATKQLCIYTDRYSQIQNLPSFLGSTECTAQFKELSVRDLYPSDSEDDRSGKPTLDFVRRYGGGQWLTHASKEAENGNPMTLPATFDLVGVLTDPTFCDTFDLIGMRQFSGTAILRTSCMEYRQLLKGCRQFWVNRRYVEECAMDNLSHGDVLFKGVDVILSFGSLQTVRQTLDNSNAINQPLNDKYRWKYAITHVSATVPFHTSTTPGSRSD